MYFSPLECLMGVATTEKAPSFPNQTLPSGLFKLSESSNTLLHMYSSATFFHLPIGLLLLVPLISLKDTFSQTSCSIFSIMIKPPYCISLYPVRHSTFHSSCKNSKTTSFINIYMIFCSHLFILLFHMPLSNKYLS